MQIGSDIVKEILYESELFNEKSKGMFPFKIVVERETESSNDIAMATVTVYRVEYQSIGNKMIPQKTILSASSWKNT